MTTLVAYYKDGIPYDSHNMVIITITGEIPKDEGNSTGVVNDYGRNLSYNPSSISVTIDPLKFAENVSGIHKYELSLALSETTQKQTTLDQALSDAQRNSIESGQELLNLVNPSPLQYTQTLINFQNSLVKEFEAKIASEQNAITYIEQDIMLNNARVWWPDSLDDAAAAQLYIQSRENDKAEINLLINNDQQQKVNLQSGQVKTKSDLDVIQDAVKFTADFYKEVSNKFGERAGALAQDFENRVRGKTLKSAEQALSAFNKYKNALNSKFSVSDRNAIANALASLEQSKLAANLAKYSRAMSLVSYSIDGVQLLQTLKSSVESNDYKPFYLKVEAILVGMAAAELLAWSFAVLTGTGVGIIGFGLILAVVGAAIDESFVSDVNGIFFG